MEWTKLGRIFTPKFTTASLRTHASNPVAIHLRDNIFRVFFSGRDSFNRSSIGHFDFDLIRMSVLSVGEEPDLHFGLPKTYYESGISLGNAFNFNQQSYMGFMGWQTPKNKHWRGDVGLIKIDSNLSLSVSSAFPIFKPEDYGYISASYPFFRPLEEDGNYSVWIGVTETWDAGNGEMLHRLCEFEWSDRQGWSEEKASVPYELGRAQAFSRPMYWKTFDDIENLWFSYRAGDGSRYRIGHSTKASGGDWSFPRMANGLDTSDSDDAWDSEMICYPYVFHHENSLYMLYNGNGFGQTGIGLAVAAHI